MRRAMGGAAAAAIVLAGCILSTSLSDLSGGADDAGSDGAVPPTAPPPPPLAPPPPGTDATPGTDAAVEASADAGAPIQFVQATAAAWDAGAATVTFPLSVAAHDTIVLALDVTPIGVSLVSVTDSQGDTFQTVIGPWDSSATTANGLRQYVALALDAKGGTATTTVTATFDAAFTDTELYLLEYANVGAFDHGGAANSPSKAIDGVTTTPIVASGPNELLWAFTVSVGGGADAGTGFTSRSGFHANVVEDRLLDAPGSYAATASLRSGVEGMIVGATLKPR